MFVFLRVGHASLMFSCINITLSMVTEKLWKVYCENAVFSSEAVNQRCVPVNNNPHVRGGCQFSSNRLWCG